MTFLSIASAAINAVGLRRSRRGRRLIAGLNAVGERGAKLLYLRRDTPVAVAGHKMFLSGRHSPSLGFLSDVVHDRYEVEMKGLLCGLLREGMTVFDVGAHVGYYTLMAAQKVGPRGHVFAFEPEPENYSILKKNIELNGYMNVTCIPKAVSSRSGTLSLFVSRQGNDRHTIVNTPSAVCLSESHDVPTISLDEFAASLGWPQVDLIKMDIEGAEPLALAGMSELLGRSPCLSLLLEFAPEMLRGGAADPLEFLSTLRKLGFAITPVEADMPKWACETSHLPSIVEIEKRGAINLLCQKGTLPVIAAIRL